MLKKSSYDIRIKPTDSILGAEGCIFSQFVAIVTLRDPTLGMYVPASLSVCGNSMMASRVMSQTQKIGVLVWRVSRGGEPEGRPAPVSEPAAGYSGRRLPISFSTSSRISQDFTSSFILVWSG